MKLVVTDKGCKSVKFRGPRVMKQNSQSAQVDRPQNSRGKSGGSDERPASRTAHSTVVLPGENPEDFQQLCDNRETEWQPQSRTEQFYIEQMAISQMKLTRIERPKKAS